MKKIHKDKIGQFLLIYSMMIIMAFAKNKEKIIDDAGMVKFFINVQIVLSHRGRV